MDGSHGGGSGRNQKNVFGGMLERCSVDPLTGFFRDGCCNTHYSDRGLHTVCVVMTDEFLEFSRNMGNDLSTPRPEFDFPGLRANDQWCLCAVRWEEARLAGKAPKVRLRSTNRVALAMVELEHLKEHAIDLQ